MGKRDKGEVRLEQLIKQVEPALLSSLMSILNKDDARDVMQECYLKLLEMVNSGKQITYPKALLFRMARNTAISKLRHYNVISSSLRAVYDADALRLEQLDTEEQLKQQQQQQLLMQAIDTLPPACKQVFMMRKLEHKSHAEISQILSISTKTVENHISQALKRCRKFIFNHYKQEVNNARAQNKVTSKKVS
ncbi:sigma-70 family RNA polymerase sigma factor [Thalassotalea ponticola]|uniref:RNA polymerase sigma factor n=1 Tax=Thalassotalea ponticola TaxID=1523392 RepID=UPI0025B57A28|nr:sigma-70 family RNA polymerase sigma factor [Thalassotalea ponticola]MDN3653925.1 sigma-70 family RNA polymerase sigma factor [Thalassotalea ponticola]